MCQVTEWPVIQTQYIYATNRRVERWFKQSTFQWLTCLLGTSTSQLEGLLRARRTACRLPTPLFYKRSWQEMTLFGLSPLWFSYILNHTTPVTGRGAEPNAEFPPVPLCLDFDRAALVLPRMKYHERRHLSMKALETFNKRVFQSIQD